MEEITNYLLWRTIQWRGENGDVREMGELTEEFSSAVFVVVVCLLYSRPCTC
jgi:hypothetical protein